MLARLRGEFALVVADEWHGHGVGTRLMEALFDAARARGLSSLEGEILRVNHRMLHLVTNLGFRISDLEDDKSILKATKLL